MLPLAQKLKKPEAWRGGLNCKVAMYRLELRSSRPTCSYQALLPGIGWHSGKATEEQRAKLRGLLNLIIKENSVPSRRRQDHAVCCQYAGRLPYLKIWRRSEICHWSLRVELVWAALLKPTRNMSRFPTVLLPMPGSSKVLNDPRRHARTSAGAWPRTGRHPQ